MLGDVEVDDKRLKPTNGYRAVHLIVKRQGRLVEVQVRTRVQHLWAELSEKISDMYGQGIKYGTGEPWALSFLSDLSTVTAKLEAIQLEKFRLSVKKISSGRDRKMQKKNKDLNQTERQYFREVKTLFASIPAIGK